MKRLHKKKAYNNRAFEDISTIICVRFKTRLIVVRKRVLTAMRFSLLWSSNHTSIQVLLALVASEDMKLKELNVNVTFLHDHSKEDILICHPKCFKMEGQEDQVCKLIGHCTS